MARGRGRALQAVMDPIRRFASPAFETRPPDIRNAHLIPAAAHAAMAPAWTQRHHPARTVVMTAHEGAYTMGEGLAFDAAGAVIPATVTQHSPAEIAAAAAVLQGARATGIIPTLPGSSLLCAKRGAANYGHWLYEMLPIAALSADMLRSGAWHALVPGAAEPLATVVRDGFDLLGLPPARILTPAPQRCERLLVMEGLTAHGGTISPLVAGVLSGLAQPVAPGGADRVWVCRAGAARSLWNEAEVTRVLAGLGWTIARPGAMRFAEQIALFRGARRIAGVMGAGLANLAFAAPGAHVTAFAPASMPDTFFYLLSELCGHEYVEVRCHHGPQAGLDPWDAALVLSLPDVLVHVGLKPNRLETGSCPP